jgi:hypothetical protein
MTNTSIEFAIFDKYENVVAYETNISKANQVWSKVFDRTYGENECPSDKIVIGCIDDKPVCCGILDVYLNTSLISCVASNPKNSGYGTLLMEYITDYLKKSDINKIHLNIDINDNSDRLINFYSKFGFVRQDADDADTDADIDNSIFEYDSDIEYRMTRTAGW